MGFNYMDQNRDEKISGEEYVFYVEKMYQYTQIKEFKVEFKPK